VDNFTEKTPIFVREQISDQLLQCYYASDDLASCLELAVDIFLENPNATIKISLRELLDRIEANHKKFSDNICLPILYLIINKDKRAIYIGLDNFLVTLGLNKPTELLTRQDRFKKKYLICLLHKVCVIDVFDNSPVFEGTNELEGERISICRFLGEHDPVNIKTYSDEFILLTRKARVRRGMQFIDESRLWRSAY